MLQDVIDYSSELIISKMANINTNVILVSQGGGGKRTHTSNPEISVPDNKDVEVPSELTSEEVPLAATNSNSTDVFF